MIRHLSTLVLCGVLGSMVLVGNAEACHKRNCGHVMTVCAAPAPCVMPAPCVKPLRPGRPAPSRLLASRVRPVHRSSSFCFKLPTFCHKKARCATPVAACAPTPVYYSYAAPASYPTATPQASAQH